MNVDLTEQVYGPHGDETTNKPQVETTWGRRDQPSPAAGIGRVVNAAGDRPSTVVRDKY